MRSAARCNRMSLLTFVFPNSPRNLLQNEDTLVIPSPSRDLFQNEDAPPLIPHPFEASSAGAPHGSGVRSAARCNRMSLLTFVFPNSPRNLLQNEDTLVIPSPSRDLLQNEDAPPLIPHPFEASSAGAPRDVIEKASTSSAGPRGIS